MSKRYSGIGAGVLPILIVVSSLLISASIQLHQAVHAAIGPAPSWALPYPTNTRISIGSFGLHGDNFQAITDDTPGATSYTLMKQTDSDALDLVLEPEVSSGTASTPTLPLAAGKVLAVQKACHVVLVDHGDDWWSVYVHLANIAVHAGQVVRANTVLGYANTLNPGCGEQTDVEHTHISIINGSGHTGTYVSFLAQSLCGHQVLENKPGDPKSVYLDGLVKGVQQPFPVPQCQPKSATCAWTIASSPNVGSQSVLHKIAAVTANDIWAVGSGFDDTTGHTTALTEHWNGSTWSVIPSPNSSTNNNALFSVVVTAKNNVFAVGSSNDQTGNTRTLIEHWNGSTWNILPSPNRDTNNTLVGVTAISQNNIWAVGSYFSGGLGHTQTLIEHWNGITWSIITSPNVNNTDATLSDIHAVSANDIWAVGYTGPNVAFTEHSALIEHWNGHKWSIIAHPASQLNGSLVALSATSASNVWAVGQYLPSGSNSTSQTLMEHWNGTQWSVVPAAEVAGYNDSLTDISTISVNDIWAVGASQSKTYQSSQTLIEHWNGTKWNIVTSPNPDPANNFLLAVAHVPSSTSLWTVGNTGKGSSTRTLAAYYC
ncbi:hypothetical protein KSF_012270 [Reticulibacter mediterranei]|uniref:M23ase beta-sheet core domain-containing protein n=1 Tax=Reticulibacter mediterranei TaxID=2778369 RepID=A0A8J3MXP1_9CHLR|nr:M23 family metallopeptidase [Reticulibacter mediterranei]GHO91179.1 hypothetical protein KSF_012270 [Reticulibacter mediterranei]